MCKKINIKTFVVLVSCLLSGCSTLAPERTAAANLMGKNINEAYRVFGNPLFVSTETSVSTESKFYGHNFYQFYFKGLEYDQEKFNGSYMDTSQGRPILVNQFETQHVQESCRVGFWADPKTNIIDYYEVKGNCGLGGWGFGTTGILHYWGIN
ncbi:hypothetical protein [Pantoea stewartii]|uniref:hypothetical protein n=1 Tax=Pantoea stewartii TaxID=66269 RepID=UPI00345C3E4D